jgi:hypothetical protein
MPSKIGCRSKITIDTIWEQYPSGIETSRRVARRIAGGIPPIGDELTVAIRVHNGYWQTMYLQNISGAVFRFWVHRIPLILPVCGSRRNNGD